MYLVGMSEKVYIAPVAHIKESFGGRGEAGKYGISQSNWGFRSFLQNINNNVC